MVIITPISDKRKAPYLNQIRCFLVEITGIEPGDLLHAMQALSQLS